MSILKRLLNFFFLVQVDPWTKQVSKKRVFLFVFFCIFIILVLTVNLIYQPLEKISQQRNDEKRIQGLQKLREVLISYQKDYGVLPKIPEGKRFLRGGNGSATSPQNNWLGIDFSKYLNNVPTDPKFVAASTAPYPYRYTSDGFTFKLDAFLETNPDNLMQQDGGILNEPGVGVHNRTRYEVGTNLFLGF